VPRTFSHLLAGLVLRWRLAFGLGGQGKGAAAMLETLVAAAQERQRPLMRY